MKIKLAGYVYDTSIFNANNESFKERFMLIRKFENATNSKINLKNTKI